MKVYIDNSLVEVSQQTDFKLSYDLDAMIELNGDYDSEYLRFELPMSAQNISVMGDAEQPLSTTMFNQTDHTAYVEHNGAKVVWGRAFLAESQINDDGSGYYTVAIRPFVKDWEVRADETLIHQADVDYELTLGAGTIAQSWQDDQLVRFLPVKNEEQAITQGGTVIVNVMSTTDYFPFIHALSFFNNVASQEGYTIESSFLESEYFDSLYFSGRYPTKNCDSYIEKMDFLAGRVSDVSTTADSSGVVYADPYRSSNTIGNIVDVVDPNYEEDGVTSPDVFSNGGCFNVSNAAVTFTPTSELNLSFEYDLAYITDYSIVDRSELQCMNKVSLHDGSQVEFVVGNPFYDYRSEDAIVGDSEYSVIVFDYTYSATYMLTGDNSSGSEGLVLLTFAARSAELKPYTGTAYTNLKLWYRTGGDFQLYDGDWAINDGACAEQGSVNITVTVRSTPTLYPAGEPIYFRNIEFSGAEQGAEFVLSKNVTLRPLFLTQPAEGSLVEWSDISAHEYYQMDIIGAFAQMYDLRFYTDTFAKKIYIEPYNKLVDTSNVVDLTNKLDKNYPTTVAEMGHDVANLLIMEYSSGDGAVASWNVANNDDFGSWSGVIENVFAEDRSQGESDVIFTPSVNEDGIIRYASGANILQVGSRGYYGTQQDYDEDLNFPIKVVRYLGMKELDSGQIWGWPSYGTSYPFVAFHYQGEQSYSGEGVNPDSVESAGQDAYDHGFTLCFEDRDNLAGLHQYHDHRIDVYNQSKQITQYIFLEPEEIERIVLPNSLKHDWRALYKIKVMGEEILCRLKSIEDYDPTSRSSTKCVFIKEV